MGLRLLGRELPVSHELGDERVIVGQLRELAAPYEIRARVAHVADRHLAVVDERDGHRRSHPGRLVVLARALVDPAVRLLDELDDALFGRQRARRRLLARRGRSETRGDVARARASHAVRDCEERRLADERVFVAPALAARVRDTRHVAQPHRSYRSSVSPTRTRSPLASFRGFVSRAPLTNVPFVEPTSSTQTPSRRGWKRAWRMDA